MTPPKDYKEHPQNVEDRPTEKGIMYNNILTFLILAVISWVGVNITQMRDSLSEIKTTGAVMKTDIKYLDKRVTRELKYLNGKVGSVTSRVTVIERELRK